MVGREKLKVVLGADVGRVLAVVVGGVAIAPNKGFVWLKLNAVVFPNVAVVVVAGWISFTSGLSADVVLNCANSGNVELLLLAAAGGVSLAGESDFLS